MPSLPEQRQIAGQLEQADRLRRTRRYALELADTFLPAAFLKLFGDPFQNPKKWSVVALGEHIDYLTSGSRGWATYYAEKGDIFLRIQNVAKGRLLMNDLTFVRTPDNAEARRTRIRPGDVLLSMTADLGRSAAIPEGFPTAFINQHLAILRTKGLNPVFLYVLLSCDAAKRKWDTIDRNAVKSGLNFDDIRSFKIIVPPPPPPTKIRRPGRARRASASSPARSPPPGRPPLRFPPPPRLQRMIIAFRAHVVIARKFLRKLSES